MGNYQEVLRQMSPLREVDPGQNRVHMFGNPFKLAKDQVKLKYTLTLSLPRVTSI